MTTGSKNFEHPLQCSLPPRRRAKRLTAGRGEPKYTCLEKRLAEFPVITVPTITLESDAKKAFVDALDVAQG